MEKPIRFGNWEVREDGIYWEATSIGRGRDYHIPDHDLNKQGKGERIGMYDWLIHMTEKDWLDHSDFYTLNTAFVYSLEKFGHNLTKNSFVKSLEEQQRRMKKYRAVTLT